MSLDEALAQEGLPAVRFFTWKPAGISLGWKQPRPEWLEAERWTRAGLALVERPTGGGMALHGSDLSVSVVIPRDFRLPLGALMDAVCRSTTRLCRAFGARAEALLDCPSRARVVYCLAEPSSYAVLHGSRKLAGFALRRFRHSWLIQGSLLVRPLSPMLSEALPSPVRAAFESRACSLSEAAGCPVTEPAAAGRWAESWGDWWEDASRQEAGGRGQNARDRVGIPIPANCQPPTAY